LNVLDEEHIIFHVYYKNLVNSVVSTVIRVFNLVQALYAFTTISMIGSNVIFLLERIYFNGLITQIWRHDIPHHNTQHNNIQHNDIQHKEIICETLYNGTR